MTRVTFQEKFYPAVKETLYQAELENGLTVTLLPKMTLTKFMVW